MPSAKCVLLIDDDEDLLMALAATLQPLGYRVVTAPDAITAISVAGRERPNVVVLDVGLPGGDGTEVMHRLHTLPRLAGVPVVILTGRDPAEYERASLDAGAAAFLTKPVTGDVLVAVLEAALRGADDSETAGRADRAAALAGARVLLVDDDADLLMTMAALLRQWGMSVAVAADAVSATGAAVKQEPDVVVLDIGLPAGDGTLVMRRLHALPQLAGVPVVILTGRDPQQYRQAALEAGAAAFLTKPASADQVLDALLAALAGRVRRST